MAPNLEKPLSHGLVKERASADFAPQAFACMSSSRHNSKGSSTIVIP